MKDQQDNKSTTQTFKAIGELRKLRKNSQKDAAPVTFFTGTCTNTTTCCIT
ncbi:hypothetical protein [Nannocystis pusilla]|uniref:Uncharacterized protein n=1 Tax=Nannocystis pusilla TaxID=889268 RepID=A0ABS7TKQ4_9BACT|nr:hypothetical protein [Nannocystis pusilla]MBZ5708805.1 hypothetical protein [Nannocystis pusilla]